MQNTMKILLVFLIVAFLCVEAENDYSVIFVGRLVKNRRLALKNPSEYCLEDGYLYKSSDYSIAGISIYAAQAQDLSKLAGKIVIVYGDMDSDLNKILKKKGKAPLDYGRKQSMMQIRSDWVGPETGFSIGRSTHKRLQKLNFIRYRRIVEFKGLQIKKHPVAMQIPMQQVQQTTSRRRVRNKLNIEIIFRNVFPHKLTNIRLAGHYESMFTKPVPKEIQKKVSKLLPGQSASFIVPTITKTKYHSYRLTYIIVNTMTAEVVVDIDKFVRNR